MKRQTVLATAIALCLLGALPATGLCQAAAEYSMTTAGAASATANAGPGVNAALNSLAGKAAQQLGGRPAERATRPTVERRGVGLVPRRIVRPVPANPQLTGPVGQMRPSSNRRDAAARSAVIPCAAAPLNASPEDKTNAACKPNATVEYPSVLSLSFPKQ